MAQGMKLVTNWKTDGVEYSLADKPLFPGQDLEILLEGHLWLLGRFELPTPPDKNPRLHVTCGGPWEELDDPEAATFPIPPEISFAIPAQALLRWPTES